MLIGPYRLNLASLMLIRSPLQVLHKRRLRDPKAKERGAQELIQRLQEQHMLYASPFGSNDDWYWIFAAVKAGKLRLPFSRF